MEEIQDHTISAEMEVFPILGESLRRQEDDQVLLELEQIKYVPFVLSFSNLTYRISRRRKLTLPACFHRNAEGTQVTHDGLISNSKIILNGISGEAREGEIMAVLGASGSGKSTLIDALANRITKESLKGSVTLNGEVLESRVSKVISAYVMQDDLLFPMLTVEETLMFSAEFRLPSSVSKTKKKARVEALIDQLGLQNVAKTVIGDEGYRGVSGGERRRVSIGVDIIHDPILLFLDEPTSGLDSTSAFMVVKVLQRIARTGSIVIMSIHQPSYRILGLLHSLIFLSQGQTIYNGSPNDLPIFISEFGYSIPENENWAEFMLDLIHELEEGSPDGTKALLEFNKSWQQKNFKNKNPHSNSNSNGFGLSLNDAIGTSICKGKLVSDLTSSTRFSAFANPFYTEIIVLAKRSITNSRRRPRVMATRLGMILVTGFILATFFWHLNDSPKGVEERLGFFAFAISTTFYNCVQDLPSFVEERFILIRETAYNTYRRSSYVISNSIVAIPALIFLSIVFSVITFWAVSLAGGLSGFLYYFLTILASFWAGSSFVTFISGLVPNVLLGYVILVATLSYYLLFSGFFINKDRIPSYWIWFHFISLVKYPYEGVLRNEFDNPNTCFVRGIQMFDNTPISVVPIDTKVKLLKVLSDSTGLDISPTTCVTTGVDILRNQGINELSKWNCIWVTLAWGFLFRILFYFVLLFGSKNKRR